MFVNKWITLYSFYTGSEVLKYPEIFSPLYCGNTLGDLKLGLEGVTNFGESPNFLDMRCFFPDFSWFLKNFQTCLFEILFFQNGSDKRKWIKRLLKKLHHTPQEKNHVAKMLDNGDSLKDVNKWHQMRFGKNQQIGILPIKRRNLKR